MKRLYIKAVSLLMAAIFCTGMLTGCEALDTSLPPPEEKQEQQNRKKARPQKAIDQIYQKVGKRAGLKEPTPQELEREVGLNLEKDVAESYVRYVEGDFGADDVYIILPKEGVDENGSSHRDNVVDDLKQRKEDRIKEFSNFDVYDSFRIAQDAVIFERGSYVVMLMLEDNDMARQIIEKYIPERLNIS